MKKIILSLILIIFLFSSASALQNLVIYDDFNDNIFDSSKWTNTSSSSVGTCGGSCSASATVTESSSQLTLTSLFSTNTDGSNGNGQGTAYITSTNVTKALNITIVGKSTNNQNTANSYFRENYYAIYIGGTIITDSQITSGTASTPSKTQVYGDLNTGNYYILRDGNNWKIYKDGSLLRTLTSLSGKLSIEVFSKGTENDNSGVVRAESSLTIDNVYIDGQIFTSSLDVPANNQQTISSNINFSSTSFSSNINKTNSTIFIYNSTGLFNRTTINVKGFDTNYSNFSIQLPNNLQTYLWNVQWCGQNNTGAHICIMEQNNNTLFNALFDEEFELSLIEGQSTGVNLNITIDGINQNILSLLYWNNTQTIPVKTIINSSRVRFTSNFVVPIGTGNSTGRNIIHYWRFYLPDGSLNSTTSPQQQTVYSLGFDNCTSFSSLLLNYTMYDEDAITLINGTSQNGSIQITLTATSLANQNQQTNFSRTYSVTNNARVCVSSVASGFRIDAQAQYTANNYVVEFHNIQNATLSASNFPQHIGLYPLLSARSQEFLVTFKDSSFSPLADALITVTRKYIGEGLFRTVEAPLTNNDGQALVHLVLGDVLYTIIVSKNGRVLGTFDNIVAFCNNVATGDCTINLNQLATGTSARNFQTFRNVSYNMVFNKTARTVTTTFVNLDSSNSLFNLTAILFDNRGNTTACSQTVTTSSGSLICTIPSSIGNSTIRSVFYKDGQLIAQAFYSLTDSSDTGFGYTGILMMAIMYITIPLMMITSGAGIVVGAIMGLIFGGLLNLYTGGGIIGIGSTIIWFIIAGAIIIYKINNLRQS